MKILNRTNEIREKATFFQKLRLHRLGWDGDYDNILKEEVEDIIRTIKKK